MQKSTTKTKDRDLANKIVEQHSAPLLYVVRSQNLHPRRTYEVFESAKRQLLQLGFVHEETWDGVSPLVRDVFEAMAERYCYPVGWTNV